MISKTRRRIPFPIDLVWIVVLLLLALAYASSLISCSGGRDSPRSIALDTRDCLNSLSDSAGWTLAVRCTCVSDAWRRCLKLGLPRDCGWDGWVDRDHDAWSIAACEQRLDSEGWRP